MRSPTDSAADIFREHAALSGFENGGPRDFDIGGARRCFRRARSTRSSRCNGRCAPGAPWRNTRFFAAGGYYTPDRKARFVAPERPALSEATSAQFPYHLNTGRVRDQWHTMTRTGTSPSLRVHSPEPFVEVHPADASRRPR